MNALVEGAVLIAALGASGPGEAREDLGRAVLGARSPELGSFTLYGALGMALILPHITLGGRAGLGGGASVDVAYRNLAIFGQQARLRIGYGRDAGPIDLGIAFRTSYSTLELADGGLIGIEFSSLPIGNDWEIGNDLVITWNRPGSAHITASVGPTFTLGGIRYVGFEERAEGFGFDPSIRGIETAVQGEWGLWSKVNVFLRLDALILLGLEEDEACVEAQQENCGELVPFGFVPTGTVGLAWAW